MNERTLVIEGVVTRASNKMRRKYEKRMWRELHAGKCSGCDKPCVPIRKLMRSSFRQWLLWQASMN